MTNEEAIDLLINRVASSCHNCNRAHKTMEDCAPCEEALSLAVKAIESIDRITAERDAAVKDLSRLDDNCFCCKWWKRDEADRRLFRCKCHNICCANSNDEKDPDLWEWRGVQNEQTD